MAHRAAAVCCENDYLTHVHAEGCAGLPAVRVQCMHAHAGLDEVTLQHTNKRGFKRRVSNRPAHSHRICCGCLKRCVKATKQSKTYSFHTHLSIL